MKLRLYRYEYGVREREGRYWVVDLRTRTFRTLKAQRKFTKSIKQNPAAEYYANATKEVGLWQWLTKRWV